MKLWWRSGAFHDLSHIPLLLSPPVTVLPHIHSMEQMTRYTHIVELSIESCGWHTSGEDQEKDVDQHENSQSQKQLPISYCLGTV